MKILITGSKGMLAKAVINRFKDDNELILTDRDTLDITKIEDVIAFVKVNNPEIIINCAAYTAVDKAEEDNEQAEKVNSIGPMNLAIACKSVNAILVHISTDYVFKGDLNTKLCYKETDKTEPITVYGITKLHGEEAVMKNCSKYYIFRTAWLFGDGKNFVKTMINIGKEMPFVRVVADQHGSPTYTEDLADIIYQAINKKIEYGIYHATNLGFTTWYEFTQEIYDLSDIKCEVQPIKSEEFKTAAVRPKNSKLSKDKLIEAGIEIPIYQDALKRYLKNELK